MSRTQEPPLLWRGHVLHDDLRHGTPHWQTETELFSAWVSRLGDAHYYAVIDLKNHEDPMHQVGASGGDSSDPVAALCAAFDGARERAELIAKCFAALKGDAS